MQLRTAGGHIYCWLFLSVQLETIISKAVPIYSYSQTHTPLQGLKTTYYTTLDNIASLVPKMSVQS